MPKLGVCAETGKTMVVDSPAVVCAVPIEHQKSTTDTKPNRMVQGLVNAGGNVVGSVLNDVPEAKKAKVKA